MKTSQIMIAIAAVLLAASFAGIAVFDDEADAAEGDYTVTVVTEDGARLPYSAPAGVIEMPDADSVATFIVAPEGYKLTGWIDTTSGMIYTAGTQYTITQNIEVRPYFTISAENYATFVVGSETFIVTITPTGDPQTYPVDISDRTDISEAIAVIEDDGTKLFKGWFDADGKELDLTDGVADAVNKATYTAQFIDIYNVYWILENGTILASGTTESPAEMKKPADPIQENHVFIGWFDADGVKYTVDDETTADVDESYKFTKDTTFTAKFEADLVSVTFMVGDIEYDSMEVRYGGTASKVALPEGYAYWAIQTKAPVHAEDGVTVVTPAEYAEYDFSKAVISDLTLYAIAAEAPEPDESIYATFNIEGTIYGPYKVTDRFSIPQTDREGYEFLGWTVQGGDGTKLTSAQVQNYQYTEDVTFVAVYEVVEPPAPEEPGFFETSTGKTVGVLIAFVIVLLIAAVYLNLWDLRTKLFGWKIERKGKE